MCMTGLRGGADTGGGLGAGKGLVFAAASGMDYLLKSMAALV
jgi:hypothetical protein